MREFDARPWLASLLSHLNRHAHLATAITGVNGRKARVQPCGSLKILAAWVRTMRAVDPIEISTFSDDFGDVHLATAGFLADGTWAAVAVVVRDGDTELLAANTPIKAGATFPVELLLQLAESPAAVEEAVTL